MVSMSVRERAGGSGWREFIKNDYKIIIINDIVGYVRDNVLEELLWSC